MAYQLPRQTVNHGPRVSNVYALQGEDVLFLDNEFLRVAVNATHGASIQELLYKPADLDVLYKNPDGVRPLAATVPPTADVAPLFDYHPGGWYECFPNGSVSVEADGAKLGFHGELYATPFEVVALRQSAEECAVTLSGVCLRYPFRLTKTLSLRKGDPTLYLEETAANLAPYELAVHWGQHPMLGAPFLDEHCRIEMDATGYFDDRDDPLLRMRWPVTPDGQDLRAVKPAGSGTSKMFYVTDFAEGKYRVVSPTWKLAFELEWDAEKFPYCWLYENAGVKGWPWFGRTHALSLEPFTGMPKAHELGHGLIRIPGQGTETARFAARIVPA